MQQQLSGPNTHGDTPLQLHVCVEGYYRLQSELAATCSFELRVPPAVKGKACALLAVLMHRAQDRNDWPLRQEGSDLTMSYAGGGQRVGHLSLL